MGNEKASDYSARNNQTIKLTVPIEKVFQSSYNPRTHFDEDALEELAQSIRAHGLIQPIVTRRIVEGEVERYEIMAGERRWRACRLAELTEIDCIAYLECTDEQALEIALIENICRRDINPVEAATGFKKLKDLGLTETQIAERTGYKQPTIANMIRVLQLPTEVVDLIEQGQISITHGKALLAFRAYPEILKRAAARALAGAPSKQLEKPDYNFYYQMCYGENAPVRTYYAGSRAPIDTTVCEGCEHLREVPDQWNQDNHVCLNPSCYDKLVDERKYATFQEIKEKNTGVRVVRESDLKTGSYDSISPNLPECKLSSCPSYAIAVGDSGYQHIVCTNPSCLRGLKIKKGRESKADKKELLKGKVGVMQNIMDSGQQLSRVAAIACLPVFDNASESSINAALTRSGWDLNTEVFKGYRHTDEDKLEALSELRLEQIVSLACEIRLREEMKNHLQNGMNINETNWLVGISGYSESDIYHE